MTNEEKAREIVFGWADTIQEDAYDAAIEMAEWKDDAIRDIIKKEIDRANKYYDQKLSITQEVASIRVIQVLSELIGEKFPYDELHMAFATMD